MAARCESAWGWNQEIVSEAFFIGQEHPGASLAGEAPALGKETDTMNPIGICEWCLPVEGPFGLEYAKRAGFEGVQLGDLGGSEKGFPMNSPWIQQGYLETAARTGMALHSIHLHTMVSQAGHVYPMDSPRGEAASESIRKGVEACQAMGIDCLNISAFFESYVRNDYDQKNLVDHLRLAVAYGADRGVRVVYEPGVTLDRVLRILEQVPGLTINYDLLNPIFSGRGDPATEIPAIGIDRIDHVHIKDVRLDHLGRFTGGACLSGDGGGRIAQSIAMLREGGYGKWYLSEASYYNPAGFGESSEVLQAMEKDVARIRAMVKGD